MNAYLHSEITANWETPSAHSSIVCPPRSASRHNGRMRVIAGTYRSRPLLAPKGDRTRPTTDRLRETLFNILAPRVAGSRFADLYAGTGAVGIEAISRGAAPVWLTEQADPHLTPLRTQLHTL